MNPTLPIINIAALCSDKSTQLARDKTAKELFNAFSQIGFAIVVGHRVPATIVQEMRAAVASVYDTPREQLATQLVEKGNYRGYVPVGYFSPNSGKGKADQYEAWKLHFETSPDDPICQESELYGQNKWSDGGGRVKSAVLTYWQEMTRVSNAVLSALCEEMGLDTDYILSCMEKPLTNMTLLNYPPTDPNDDVWGIHPHKDFNILTLLAHDPVGGLEVRTRNGDWIHADCPPDGFVMNVGDMLELWSGGHLISTPHRVTNRSGKPRQSFPFFAVPRYDVVIDPLLPLADGYAERQSLHVGNSSKDIWYSNWPDTVSTDPAQILGDFDT